MEPVAWQHESAAIPEVLGLLRSCLSTGPLSISQPTPHSDWSPLQCWLSARVQWPPLRTMVAGSPPHWVADASSSAGSGAGRKLTSSLYRPRHSLDRWPWCPWETAWRGAASPLVDQGWFSSTAWYLESEQVLRTKHSGRKLQFVCLQL